MKPPLTAPDEEAAYAAFWMHGWLTSLVEDPSATETEQEVARRALENWYLDNPCMKPKEGDEQV